jgi:Gpi18-like mannosyltransferase
VDQEQNPPSFHRNLKENLATIFTSTLRFAKSLDYISLTILALCLFLAIALRVSLINFKSVDFYRYSNHWYNIIKEQGFRVFQTEFNVDDRPHMYFLYAIIRFFPDLPAVIATKIPSIVADFVCAWFVYRIVQLRFKNSPIPFFSFFAVLFAPTVILNSAMWGQSDSLYVASLIAFIYFFLTKRNALACLTFGLALAFKPQALFLSPLLAALFLEKQISWKNLLLVPLTIIVMLSPAWLTRGQLPQIVQEYTSGVSQYGMLSMNAPGFFSVLPGQGMYYNLLLLPGLMIAFSLVLLFIYLIHIGHPEFTPARVIELTLAILLLMPFFLPKMHDRYFYPADVVSIVYAFYFPQYFFIPLIISTISFLVYQPFLFGQEPVPMPILAAAMFITICFVMRNVIMNLYLLKLKPKPEDLKQNLEHED